jgi:hypothetical protein
MMRGFAEGLPPITAPREYIDVDFFGKVTVIRGYASKNLIVLLYSDKWRGFCAARGI